MPDGVILPEPTTPPSKPWYLSKAVWAAVIAILVAFYNSFNAELAPLIGMTFPDIPEWIFGILGALGLWGRVTANTTITR